MSSEEVVTFKRPKKKVQIRRKRPEEENEEEDEEQGVSRIEDIKELQKARERKGGLNEMECAVGRERAIQLNAGDEVQLSGGQIIMTQKQKAKIEAQDIERGMKEQFEKETLLRDEHEELRKFIEQGMNGKGGGSAKEPAGASGQRAVKTSDTILARAASKLNKFRSEQGTELLSNQMLAGIPEVDLGINARINNILETERKKKELLEQAILKANGKAPAEPPADEECQTKKLRLSTD